MALGEKVATRDTSQVPSSMAPYALRCGIRAPLGLVLLGLGDSNPLWIETVHSIHFEDQIVLLGLVHLEAITPFTFEE